MKNIQTKIIIIFSLIVIFIFSAAGLFAILQTKNLDSTQNVEIVFIKSFGIAIALIAVITGVFIWFTNKIIAKPIYKLTENANKIAEGNMLDMNDLIIEDTKTDIDELINAFSKMNNKLNEKINETLRQKKQIETILLHMTDGIIAFDIEGEIIHINPAAKNLLELQDSENSFEKIFEKLNLNMNIEKIIYLENWTSTEQKVSIGERYVNLLFAPFKDENERPCGVIAVIQDITEHVRLDNMRKEFVADVSHELKTPITSIMGYADTLLEGEYEKEIKDKFLGVISSEAGRMARLVNDLLTLSKYDNKESKCEKTEFDLGELVKRIQENLALETQKKNQKVECYVTANVPLVYADKYGIERVVINILTNSIKYTSEGGNIKIYVGFVYNDAYIKIIDNGIGIPEEDLNRIFERFYRVDKARSRMLGGTGLGLSIAKEILDQNNGSIVINSEVNKGTEVVIRIPTKSTETRKKASKELDK